MLLKAGIDRELIDEAKPDHFDLQSEPWLPLRQSCFIDYRYCLTAISPWGDFNWLDDRRRQEEECKH